MSGGRGEGTEGKVRGFDEGKQRVLEGVTDIDWLSEGRR